VDTKPKKIDRSDWPSGPWDGEPDRVEWKTSAGLPALITRTTSNGHLCGYVAVPPGHPAHGVIDDGNYYDHDINVHGGVTYAARCQGHVCHVPEPGEPDDVWWIGFDMAHAGDLSPLMARYERLVDHESYRTVDFARAECERLAEQLAAIARNQ
jgi:hypothetical protein